MISVKLPHTRPSLLKICSKWIEIYKPGRRSVELTTLSETSLLELKNLLSSIELQIERYNPESKYNVEYKKNQRNGKQNGTNSNV
jgi:hypothetical protein